MTWNIKSFQNKTNLILSLIILLIITSISVSYYSNWKEEKEFQKKLDDRKFYEEYTACEKTFDEPIDVSWEGKVIGQMVSGTQYGILKLPEDKENPYFYAGIHDEEINEAILQKRADVGLTGIVRVKGKWIGITAAYRNTIFDGKCVPYVKIESIEQI